MHKELMMNFALLFSFLCISLPLSGATQSTLTSAPNIDLQLLRSHLQQLVIHAQTPLIPLPTTVDEKKLATDVVNKIGNLIEDRVMTPIRNTLTTQNNLFRAVGFVVNFNPTENWTMYEYRSTPTDSRIIEHIINKQDLINKFNSELQDSSTEQITITDLAIDRPSKNSSSYVKTPDEIDPGSWSKPIPEDTVVYSTTCFCKIMIKIFKKNRAQAVSYPLDIFIGIFNFYDSLYMTNFGILQRFVFVHNSKHRLLADYTDNLLEEPFELYRK